MWDGAYLRIFHAPSVHQLSSNFSLLAVYMRHYNFKLEQELLLHFVLFLASLIFCVGCTHFRHDVHICEHLAFDSFVQWWQSNDDRTLDELNCTHASSLSLTSFDAKVPHNRLHNAYYRINQHPTTMCFSRLSLELLWKRWARWSIFRSKELSEADTSHFG